MDDPEDFRASESEADDEETMIEEEVSGMICSELFVRLGAGGGGLGRLLRHVALLGNSDPTQM